MISHQTTARSQLVDKKREINDEVTIKDEVSQDEVDGDSVKYFTNHLGGST